MTEIDFENLYFDEPRLKMGAFSRFLIRLIGYSFYAVFVVLTITFLFSDAEKLFWTGVLLSLFLADGIIHFGRPKRTISGLLRSPHRQKKESGVSASKRLEMFNAAQYLAPSAFSIIEKSYDKTLIVGGDFYLHSLNFLSQFSEIKNGLLRMDVNPSEFAAKITDFIAISKKEDKKNSAVELALKTEKLAKAAFVRAAISKNSFIGRRDIFAALGDVNDAAINRIFNMFGIEPADLEKAAIFRSGYWLPKTLGAFVGRPFKLRHRTMNRAWTSRPTPTLDKYGVDFTDLARAGEIGFLIGHKNEYNRLVDVLCRPFNPNALLVGEPGSGKETLAAALAYGIVKDEAPEAIFDKRIVSLEIGRLFSGASADELSARLNKIVDEIISAGNVILYVPDIHNLAKNFAGAGMSPSDIFLPLIKNDLFPVIGATYPRELKELIEPRSDFYGAFEIIRVEEISEEEAERLLTYEAVILERQYGITISFKAIKQAVLLAHKHFRQKLLPSSAEDLLKETLSYVSQKGDKLIQADDVTAVAQRKINIPLFKFDKGEAEKLLNLENIIHEFLIDQEPAVFAVSRALREYRSGLSRKGGPIAAFLFVGPTGVGKTELSKILAEIQFGSRDLMVRFDMSEYQSKESVSRFIGSADGKIAGSLTEAVIQKPYCLILLDEFEKAHPDILNLFLAVFDDARLTDSLGRTVDFTNAIIIATSNASSNFIKESIEAGNPMVQIGEELKKKLTEYFKPELLNRFSQIVVFKNLSSSDIKKIAGLKLKSLAKNLEETNGISLDFNEDIAEYVGRLGYDPVFGARPLESVISEKLRGPLAEKILKGEIFKGGAVKVLLEGDELIFHTG